jgi:hypothetical protein
MRLIFVPTSVSSNLVPELHSLDQINNSVLTSCPRWPSTSPGRPQSSRDVHAGWRREEDARPRTRSTPRPAQELSSRGVFLAGDEGVATATSFARPTHAFSAPAVHRSTISHASSTERNPLPPLACSARFTLALLWAPPGASSYVGSLLPSRRVQRAPPRHWRCPEVAPPREDQVARQNPAASVSP